MAQPIAEALSLPVYLENDVKTLAIAEQWFGSGHGVNDFAVMTVGRGIGGGFVASGQLCRGTRGGAGEIGHITVQRDGPLCQCGKRGCLEALAADPAVVRAARAAIHTGRQTVLATVPQLSFDAIVDAADAGDGLAQEVLGESGRWIGIGLANLINTLNPQLVVVGGEGLRAGSWRTEPMHATLRDHVFSDLIDDVRIFVQPSSDETWARGAACLVLGELFRSPIQKRDRAVPLLG